MMIRNGNFQSSRRSFLQLCAGGIAATRWGFGGSRQNDFPAPPSAPQTLLRLEADPQRPLIPALSWDTEGGNRFHTNLLRSPGVGLRVRPESLWLEGTELSASAEKRDGGARYRLQAARNCTLLWDVSASQGSFAMTLSTEGSAALPSGYVEMVFPFPSRGYPHYRAACGMA